MQSGMLMVLAFVTLFSVGCVSVYHVAEKPLPDGGGGIYVLKSDGSDSSAGPDYARGRDPHVTTDGSILFVKQDSSGTYQVFRGSQQLTATPGDKHNPAASLLNVAYVHDVPGQGKQIVAQNSAGAVVSQFASDANSLAFWDGGTKLVFSRRDGVYVIPVSGANTATLIVDCSGAQPQGCGPLAVSHNGQHLGYYYYLTLVPMRLAWIQILKTGSWQPVLRLTPKSFCPGCVAGQPGTPEDLGSFDFSPDDQWLYTTVRLAGPAGGSSDSNLRELFRVKLNLSATPPTATQPERLTTNGYADYHPSTRLFP